LIPLHFLMFITIGQTMCVAIIQRISSNGWEQQKDTNIESIIINDNSMIMTMFERVKQIVFYGRFDQMRKIHDTRLYCSRTKNLLHLYVLFFADLDLNRRFPRRFLDFLPAGGFIKLIIWRTASRGNFFVSGGSVCHFVFCNDKVATLYLRLYSFNASSGNNLCSHLLTVYYWELSMCIWSINSVRWGSITS